jgi:hypothetical protein
MFRWLRRNRYDDDEFEDDDESDVAAPRSPADVPQFAVIVAAPESDGWHMAAVIGETANPNFYVRALAVRRPFVIARPVPSNRTNDRQFKASDLSPTGTTPAQKLVVNWGWETVEESVSQLRFYVKRTAPRFYRKTGRVIIRLTLKESGWPRRRIVLPTKSNKVTWRSAQVEMPASPPEKST